jgi:hypothetical protein
MPMQQITHVRFEVLTVMLLKIQVFCGTMLRQLASTSQRFEECASFTFRVKQSSLLPLLDPALRCSETSGTNHPKTQHCIPVDLTVQITGSCNILNTLKSTHYFIQCNARRVYINMLHSTKHPKHKTELQV